MIGHVKSYDIKQQTGLIEVSDEQSFTFQLASWMAKEVPKSGDTVDFIEEKGQISEIERVSEHIKNERPVKRRWIASLLGLFLGALGLHRFYLGFYTIGIMQIILTLATQGYGVMWGFIEAVLLFSGHINKDAKGRFLK